MLVSSDVRREARSSAGTSDLFVQFPKWTLLAEMKLLKKNENVEKAIKKAFQQTKEKGYIEKFRPDVVFALVFDPESRSLVLRGQHQVFFEPSKEQQGKASIPHKLYSAC